MIRIAIWLVLAFGLQGCGKGDPTKPKYWESLLKNPKKVEEALNRIGDELKEPAQKEWGAQLVVKYYDQLPERAANALAKLGVNVAGAAEKLIEGLKSNDPALMAKAAAAVGAMQVQAAVPELIRILDSWVPRNPRDLTEVRKQATKALGLFRTRDAVPVLAKMVRERSHGLIVNLHALNALGEIADVRAVPALIQGLYLACPEDKCSAAARVALNRVGKAAIPDLLRVVRRKDPEVERFAKEKKLSEGSVTAVPFIVLGDIGDRATARTLVDEFVQGPESFAKVNAISAIGYCGGPEVVDDLIRAYKNSLLEARTNILHALHRIGDRKAIPFLLSVIKKGEDPNLLWTAGLAVSYLGAASELGPIQAVLRKAQADLSRMKGEDLAVTKQTIAYYKEFLARLQAAKDCGSAACWREKLRSPDKQVRMKAARMLAFAAKEKDMNEAALLAATSDPEADVREEVAFALGRIGTAQKAVPALRQRIQEDRDKAGMKGPLFLYELLVARLQGRA
jgi:HEAT repeat protein